MQEYIEEGWSGYELLASGNGVRRERFGAHTIERPDPNILWPLTKTFPKADAQFDREVDGRWIFSNPKLSDGWTIPFEGVTFRVKPTSFRHIGLFPEQAVNWRWLEQIIKEAPQPLRVLNLFAYTGGATVVAANAGANVTHVDASKGSIEWAKENAALSNVPTDRTRWICEDVRKFVAREVRRGSRYDVILLDPPVFGRGPKGEIWRLEDELAPLLELVAQLLSDTPHGFLMNFYATATYPLSIFRATESILKGRAGTLELASLDIAETQSGSRLPTGFLVRSVSRHS